MDGKLRTIEEWVSHFRKVPATQEDIMTLQREAVEQYKQSCLNPKNAARAERIRGAIRGSTNELG